MKNLPAKYAKFENILAVFFVGFMALFPLVTKLLQSLLGVIIVNNENVMVNLVFVFSCVAGAITWREDRHISLASLSDLFPKKVTDVILQIRAGAVPAILCAMFFSAFSEFFQIFTWGQTVWGIPLRLFYVFLPLAYLTMLVRSCCSKEYKIASLIGLVIGLIISMGPISGVLYYTFGLDNLNFMYSISNGWNTLAQVAFVPLIILFVLLAIMGVPLFIALAGIAYIAFSQGGGYVEVMSQEAYSVLTDSSIAAIPLFTIMGYMLSQGSAGRRLVDIFKSLFGWFKCGTVIAAVVVTTFFTMFTGASGVTILALGSLLTILLSGTGYKEDDAHSLITSSGALGLLFPPSVAIIMYGTTNYFSVDVFALFKGALIPGFILATATIIYGITKDKNIDRPKFSTSAIWEAFKSSVWELLLPVLIIVTYFTGIFTIMQTAAFALVYTYILETFIRKDFTVKESLKVIADSIPITGGVLMIWASARGISYFLIDANVPYMLSEFISSFVHSKYVFLLLLNIFLILVGCLMDIYSAILIVSPLIIPIAQSFGLSQVHIGVVFLMNMQLGFLTPPVGMDLFISTYAFDKPLMKVVKGVLPYLAIQAIVLLLVTYVPWFTTLIP